MRKRRNLTGAGAVALAAFVALAADVRGEETTTIRDLLAPYDAIRVALVADRTDGVEEGARALVESAWKLAKALPAATAEDSETEGETARELLTSIAGAGVKVAEAEDLAAAREAFFELSKPMGRYRKMTGDASTIVVYCPMAKKGWLQPDEEIGNPYYGSDMPTCGNRIAD